MIRATVVPFLYTRGGFLCEAPSSAVTGLKKTSKATRFCSLRRTRLRASWDGRAPRTTTDGGLHSKASFPLSPGGRESKTQVGSSLVPSSPCVLTRSSPVPVCVLLPCPYQDTCHIVSGPTQMAYFNLNIPLKWGPPHLGDGGEDFRIQIWRRTQPSPSGKPLSTPLTSGVLPAASAGTSPDPQPRTC